MPHPLRSGAGDPDAPGGGLTAVVLAGGAGRRFGGDKLAAALGDATVLSHAVAALRTRGLHVTVVGRRSGPAADVTADAWIPDAAPRDAGQPVPSGPRGPLAGIVAGLESADPPLVAVVAGDVPFPDVDLLLELSARWDGGPAVVPCVSGRPQPLHAVYATAAAPALRERFDAGARSPVRALRELGARFVDLPGSGRGRVPLWTRDVDTPGDLAGLRTLDAPRGR